jgi:hypothetical protein
MFGKEFYKSKTFWFFLLALVVNIAGVFGFAGYAPSIEQQEIIGIVTAVVGIVLRFLTKEPVHV